MKSDNEENNNERAKEFYRLINDIDNFNRIENAGFAEIYRFVDSLGKDNVNTSENFLVLLLRESMIKIMNYFISETSRIIEESDKFDEELVDEIFKKLHDEKGRERAEKKINKFRSKNLKVTNDFKKFKNKYKPESKRNDDLINHYLKILWKVEKIPNSLQLDSDLCSSSNWRRKLSNKTFLSSFLVVVEKHLYSNKIKDKEKIELLNQLRKYLFTKIDFINSKPVKKPKLENLLISEAKKGKNAQFDESDIKLQGYSSSDW